MNTINDGYMKNIDCDVITEIEKNVKNGKLAADEELRRSLAEKIILIEKERVRLCLIRDYGVNGKMPEICDTIDRERLINAYIAKGEQDNIHVHSYDTVEDMAEYLLSEPYKVAHWLEGVEMDIFDEQRRFDYELLLKARAIKALLKDTSAA